MLRAARALTLKRAVGVRASVLDNARQSFRRTKKNLLGQRTKKERVLKIFNKARIYNRYFSSSQGFDTNNSVIISSVVILSC